MQPLFLTTRYLNTAYSNAVLKADNNESEDDTLFEDLQYEVASFGHYIHSYLASDQITNGILMPVSRKSTVTLLQSLDNGDFIYGIYVELKYKETYDKLLNPNLYNEIFPNQDKRIPTPFGQPLPKQDWGSANVRESTKLPINYDLYHPVDRNNPQIPLQDIGQPGFWEKCNSNMGFWTCSR